MNRDEILQALAGMDGREKVAFLREKVVSGQLNIHDIVDLAPELSRQGVGTATGSGENFDAPQSNSNAAFNESPEDSTEVHRGVWMFTSVALSGLAIAAVVAYMIAHHIAH